MTIPGRMQEYPPALGISVLTVAMEQRLVWGAIVMFPAASGSKEFKDQQESERNKARGKAGVPFGATIMTKGHNLIKGITNKPASKWKINLKAT